jgi:hypothetical protein
MDDAPRHLDKVSLVPREVAARIGKGYLVHGFHQVF